MYRISLLPFLLAGLCALFVACAGPAEDTAAAETVEATPLVGTQDAAEADAAPAAADQPDDAAPELAETAGPDAPADPAEAPAVVLTPVVAPVVAPDSLVAMLPEDTIIYLAIDDIPSLRAGLRSSALGRIYHDPEMQDFLAGGLEMLGEGWVQMRAMAAGMGVPEALTHWDALRSVEAGFAMRPQAGLENPFAAPPQIYAAVRVGLAAGLAQQAFDFMTPMVEQQGFEFIASDAGGILSYEGGRGGAPMEISVMGDALLLQVKMGARGEGSLATTASYLEARQRVAGGDAAEVFAYLRLHELWGTMKTGLQHEEPEIAEMFIALLDPVLAPLQSVSMASGWDGGTSFTSLAVCLDDEPGALWQMGTADLALLDYVPADSTSFSVADYSAADAWMKHLLATLDALSGMEVEPGMTFAQMAERQGGDMHAWLFGDKRGELEAALGSIGKRGFSYGRSTGMTSEDVSFTEVDDPVALNNAFEQLMPRLREALQMAGAEVQLQAKRVKRRVPDENGEMQTVAGPAYYSLDFSSFIPPEMASFGLAVEPTMAVTDDGWMAMSMTRGPVRTALTKGVQKPEQDIRGNSDVQAFLGRVPRGAAAVAWNDPRPMLEGLLGLALGFAPMAADAVAQSGLPFDLNNLPPVNVFIDPLVPTETVTMLHGSDLVVSARGSFGFADLIGMIGAGASLAPMGMLMSADMMAPQPAEEPVIEEF